MALSTHVLDVAHGVPAAGLEVALVRIDGHDAREVARARTDADGRIVAPFGGELTSGVYELRFAAGAYHAKTGTPSFYDEIPVRFTVDDATRHYHVPLLLSPWGYSTYRGS
ncbi:MAG TPA: hydroxyisourate hydrolase [Candidatus Baltobacteraceae bacterium]|nr:hydroxyisourate hydrolase [Candidatus Baltobacteraceae bacterium]